MTSGCRLSPNCSVHGPLEVVLEQVDKVDGADDNL